MRVIDSHTAGEPTRVIVEGGPDLGSGSMAERRERFAREFDVYRRTAILEPRGSDVLVGALLCESEDASCAAGVVFFNNVGYLGMCGHGTIGTVVSLAHLGRIRPGSHQLETPVGVVKVELLNSNEATIENVPSYRYIKRAVVEVSGMGRVTGDIAWGGNWFYLVEESPCPLRLANVGKLTEAGRRIREALWKQGVVGEGGSEIDHIEFFGPPEGSGAHSRNFVLCPGNAYDRSPCGTGTSAKLACLAAEGKLSPGEVWVQESIVGSRFEACYWRGEAGRVIPQITGRAYVCGEAILLQHPEDPFREGIIQQYPREER